MAGPASDRLFVASTGLRYLARNWKFESVSLQRGVCELSVPCGASNFRFGSPTARWRAADLGADLLVIGAYRHSRVRELQLGGFTRSILQSMILPELMSH